MMGEEMQINDKIKFKNDKRPYRIKAFDDRYIIATKPFNLQKTFMYVICDLQERVRGADNYKCKFDYPDLKEAQKALKELGLGELEISWRNRRDLDIEWIGENCKRVVQNG